MRFFQGWGILYHNDLTRKFGGLRCGICAGPFCGKRAAGFSQHGETGRLVGSFGNCFENIRFPPCGHPADFSLWGCAGAAWPARDDSLHPGDSTGGIPFGSTSGTSVNRPGMTAYRRTVRSPLPPALPTPPGGLRKNGVFVLTFPAEMRTILSIHNRIFCIAVFNCLQTRSTIRRKSL